MLSYKILHILSRCIPKPLRKVCSELLNLYCGWRRVGLKEYIELRRPSSCELRSVRPQTLQFPLYYRPGTTDVEVIVGTIVREEYASPLLPDNPAMIIDAGANIGDMSCWLLSRFANAKLVAIEPNPGTFTMLKKNLAPYGDRAVAINAALWSTNCELHLQNEQTPCATTSSLFPGGSAVMAVSLTEILQLFGCERIDLFKCDIEGAEREVFSAKPQSWMDQTSMIIVETHGEDARRIVVESSISNKFKYSRYGWLHVFCK